jgi:hypothetical protein
VFSVRYPRGPPAKVLPPFYVTGESAISAVKNVFCVNSRVSAYNSSKYGGMTTLDSESIEPDAGKTSVREPLSGEKLALAVESMKSPVFLMRLVALIMKLARKKGFKSPFMDSMDLPGGKSAADLAADIVEKTLSGSYEWNHKEFPDFLDFCFSRTESILSNWLNRSSRSTTMSPLTERDAETGEPILNALNVARSGDNVISNLRFKEGEALGDRFLEHIALALPENSTEQLIILAVFDDRECANRSYCCSKLKISGEIFDAAVKRLLRRLPMLVKEWREVNKVSDSDWSEAR